MPYTHFYSAVHGFHFSNHDIEWSYGPLHNTQLCGGMSLASLDHYYNGVPIPATTTAPPEGTELHRYIYNRQLQAHAFAIPTLAGSRFASGRFRNDPLNYDTCARGRVFRAIKEHIDQRQPVPVLLAARGGAMSTSSHWVTAIGYSEADGHLTNLHLYDNNRPGLTTQLTPRLAAEAFFIGGRAYSFYVPWADAPLRDPRRPLDDVSIGGWAPNFLGLPPVGM